MTEEMIKNLIEKKGFKRWIKGDKDRLYIKAYELPFVKTNWKKNGKKTLSLFGEELSYTKSSQLDHAQFYIDVKTGEAVTSIEWAKTKEEFENFVKSVCYGYL